MDGILVEMVVMVGIQSFTSGCLNFIIRKGQDLPSAQSEDRRSSDNGGCLAET